MEIIEQIGSYAGLAAVLGLAIMSALYFSQARDVKRLREWAGRAPERTDAPGPTQPQRVVAKPVPKPPGAAQPATGAQPAAGAQPTAGAQPGVAQPAQGAKPPVPLPGGAQTAAAQASAGAAPAVAAGPAAATPAAARAAGGGTGVDDPPAAPAESPNGTDEQAAISQDTVIHPVPGDGPQAPAETDPADDHEDDDGPGAESGEPAAADLGPDDAGADPASAGEPEPDEDAPEAGVVADRDTDNEHEQSPADEQVDGHEDGEDREDPAAAIEPAGAADLPAPEKFHESYEVDEPAEAPPAAAPPVPPRRPPVKIGTGPRPTVPDRGPREPLLPPYEQSRPGGALSKGEPASDGFFSSRRRALLVMGGTVLGIAVLAFGVQQLTGEDDGGGGAEPASNSDQAEEADTPQRSQRPAAIDPGKVTVAVLNGTTVPGLARQIGDTVERQGFQLGTITNFIDQQRAESVVLYAPGAEREAADVGRRLKISQREPVDADSQGQAGDATVVVVAGADKTR